MTLCHYGTTTPGVPVGTNGYQWVPVCTSGYEDQISGATYISDVVFAFIPLRENSPSFGGFVEVRIGPGCFQQICTQGRAQTPPPGDFHACGKGFLGGGERISK